MGGLERNLKELRDNIEYYKKTNKDKDLKVIEHIIFMSAKIIEDLSQIINSERGRMARHRHKTIYNLYTEKPAW